MLYLLSLSYSGSPITRFHSRAIALLEIAVEDDEKPTRNPTILSAIRTAWLARVQMRRSYDYHGSIEPELPMTLPRRVHRIYAYCAHLCANEFEQVLSIFVTRITCDHFDMTIDWHLVTEYIDWVYALLNLAPQCTRRLISYEQ
jgi:hypothetical protein